MFTKEFLLKKGFFQDSLEDDLYLKELSDLVEGVYQDDSVVLEIDIDSQTIHFSYVNLNDKILKDNVLYIFFNKIKTDNQLGLFLDLIN